MSTPPPSYKRLWSLFAFVVLASFAVLGGFGFRIASEAHPIPDKVFAGDRLLTWYARSAEFLQTPTMNTLRWLLVPGDTLFALGVLAIGWFKLGLLTGHSFVKDAPDVPAGQLTTDRHPVGVP